MQPFQSTTAQQSLIETPFTTGRTTGILLLLQLMAGLTLPFLLYSHITSGSPAYLAAVAAHSPQVTAGILVSFAGSALTVCIGITIFKIFQRYSKSFALLFLVACTISCTLDLVQAGNVMSMVSISKQAVNAGATGSELYKVVGAAVASARRSAHAVQLLAIGAWMFTFYFTLFRFRLIPTLLSVIGIVGVLLQFTGVTLMMLLRYPQIGEMAMPLLPIHITVAVWLIVKGFK